MRFVRFYIYLLLALLALAGAFVGGEYVGSHAFGTPPVPAGAFGPPPLAGSQPCANSPPPVCTRC